MNLNKDIVVQHITGKKPKPLLWRLREASDRRSAEIKHLNQNKNSFQYPSSIDDDQHFPEPIGLEFARHKNWSETDARVQASNWTLASTESAPSAVAAAAASAASIAPAASASPITGISPAAMTPPTTVAEANVQESHDFPMNNDNYSLPSEIVDMAVAIGDTAAAESNAIAAPERLNQPSNNYYHGSTRWNRPIGPRAGRTFADMRVPVPLNPFQQSRFISFVTTVTSQRDKLTQNEMATRVCKLWNDEHLRLIGQANEHGLGGILENSTAKDYLNVMNNSAYALKPMQQQPPPILPQPSIIQQPMFPQHLSRSSFASETVLPAKHALEIEDKAVRGRGRPRKEHTKLKPLNEVTVEYAESLGHRELYQYTMELVGRKPRQKSDCLKIVLDHIKKKG
jgi:hypothetical protein